MGGMFDNYNNLNKPMPPASNICPPPPFKPIQPKLPYEEYNADGELVGYFWGYGDTINLEFLLDGYVTIDEADTYIEARDFIKNKDIKITIYNFRHEEVASQEFKGNDYQNPTYSRAINVDAKTHGIYYIYSETENGGSYTGVDLPQDYQVGTIYYQKDPVAIIFEINQELSLSLVRGIYYCSMEIKSDDFTSTVFYQDTCTLRVK